MARLQVERLRQVTPADVAHAGDDKQEWKRAGELAMQNGQVAVCVLAGGAATRLRGALPKALVEITPGKRFIDFFLDACARARLHLWIMTSSITHAQMSAAVGNAPNVRLFQQFDSPRITEAGQLARTPAGHVSMAPTGHGDFQEALSLSGLLYRFIAGGGAHVNVRNVDNLTFIDPVTFGQHIMSGADMSVELVKRDMTDAGGVPAMFDERPIIAESFEVDQQFTEAAQYHNTNVITFKVEALHHVTYPWTYHTVRKVVDGQNVFQKERLIHEAARWLKTNMVVVPRERFCAVKTEDDLVRLRERLLAEARAA